MRRLAILAVTTLLLAGCGTANGTPAVPGGSGANAAPGSPSSTVAVGNQNSGSGNAAGETAAPAASTPADQGVAHDAPDLEATLPSQLNGVPLSKQSYTAGQTLSADESSQSMRDYLASVGKTGADLEIAAATDETGALDIGIYAFRVAGVNASGLASAIISSGLTASPESEQVAVTLDGRQVIQVTDPVAGTTVYVYTKGDTVYGVESSDPALAKQALSLLP